MAKHWLPALLACCPWPACGDSELLAVYGSEAMISLATGYRQPLSLAPAVASVITAEDIARLGATTLAEVLETVPGLHVSSARGISDVFVIRGFFHSTNPQVLVLINGIPINDVVNGGRPQAWRLPVHDIARVEIVRGPGSALYGADAFAGVIDVITKTAADIDGTEAGVLAGRFDTAGGWLLHGRRGEDLDLALSLHAETTSGYRGRVGFDEQSRIDALFGTGASLAPGSTRSGRDDINLRVDATWRDRWRLRAGYQGFLNVGTGVGTALALDPVGEIDVELVNLDLTYFWPTGDDWQVELQGSLLRTETRADLTLLPAGTLAGAFPDGVLSDFAFVVDQARLGLTALYQGVETHRLRFGAGFHYAENTTRESKNFVERGDGLILPAGIFTDTATLGVPPVVDNETRRVFYGFFQDDWHFAADWHLTTGVRVDRYSDFGTTVNPRLALVWNATPGLSLKALYGRAFRAPTFIDLYGNSGVVAIGHEHIEPETIDTLELAALQRWSAGLETRLSVFGYQTDDIILVEPTDPSAPLSPATDRNIAGTRGYGLEFDADFRLNPDWRIGFNYAYQHAEDKETDTRFSIGPRRQAQLQLDWRLRPSWHLNARLNYLDDPHDALSADLTLRHTDPAGRFAVSLSAFDLFNDAAPEPTLFPASLPDGVPQPGRRLVAQLKFAF